jgi:hypothetical protein
LLLLETGSIWLGNLLAHEGAIAREMTALDFEHVLRTGVATEEPTPGTKGPWRCTVVGDTTGNRRARIVIEVYKERGRVLEFTLLSAEGV